jgi:hypothetical protein
LPFVIAAGALAAESVRMGVDRANGWRRRFAALAGAALFVVSPAALPQAMPIPVVPHPGLIAAGVVLNIILWGALLAPGDEKQVRQLEQQQDWKALVALATTRIDRIAASMREAPAGAQRAPAASPGDEPTPGGRAAASPAEDPSKALARWYLVRAHALQRLGDCAAAVRDHEAAVAAGTLLAAAELEHGACETWLRRWDEAQRVYLRLAAADPKLSEPWQQLAIVRAYTGDAAGAREALEQLRTRDAAAAAALDAGYLAGVTERGASTAQGGAFVARFPPAGPDLARATPPAALPSSEIVIDARTLRLPPGGWVLVARPESTEVGRKAGAATVTSEAKGVPVPVLAGTVVAARAGALDAVVHFEANARPADGLDRWEVDRCLAPGALLVDRFAKRFDTPECLSLRRIDPSSPGAPTAARAAVRFAGEQALTVRRDWYEVHYSSYTFGGFAAVTVLLPVTALPGDGAAVLWARQFAQAMRPLAEIGPRSAAIPTVLP